MSGHGQVIDAAMTDGAALQMAMIYGCKAAGKWNNQRGSNLLDGGAHFYDTYECADGKYVAIGALEPEFYALLLEKTGARDPAFQAQMDDALWPDSKNRFDTLFKTRTRDEWCALMEGTDVCFTPVLDLDEAPRHPHNVKRETFTEVNGVTQPAPAPRFSRTAPEIQGTPPIAGEHNDVVLTDFGFSPGEIAKLKRSGAI
jgi:alpha-methylacyl-CoA racemase